MSRRPNILLIVTDQQRGDCLGAAGHRCLLTPQMDELAAEGVRFVSAYTTCPACQPTRRSLMGGNFPARNGAVTNTSQTWQRQDLLPQILRDSGYHTGLVGHMVYPAPKRYGFEERIHEGDWRHDCLNQQMPDSGFGYGTGAGPNDRTVRSWHLDEQSHPVTWSTTQGLRFLRRRDPSRPWFLTVSYLAPHPPAVPPDFYFQRYLRADIPEPMIGDWAKEPDFPFAIAPVDSPRANIKGQLLREYRAAYYAAINHIDDQIRRIIKDPAVDKDNTIIIFLSDHGDMLGDHYLTRKTMPYDGDARVPFIVRLPDSVNSARRGQVSELPVCHEDIMPTLLDLANVPCPDNLDGKSLVPALTGGDTSHWRKSLHIEYGQGGTDPFHAVTDGKEKFIWFSQTGQEQFFNLEQDPDELHDLMDSPENKQRIEQWRQNLISAISWRGEGFVQDGKLVAGRPHPGRTSEYNSI